MELAKRATSLALIALAVLGATPAPVQTSTINIVDISLTTESGTYTDLGALPSGWAISSSGGDGLLISCTKTASRKGNQYSPPMALEMTAGTCSVTFLCADNSYTEPASPLFTSRTIYIKGEASTEKTGCKALGEGRSLNKAAVAKSQDISAGYENPWSMTLKFKQPTVWTGSANDWEAVVEIPGWRQAVFAMAYNPSNGGGNSTVAYGKGLSNLTIDPYFPSVGIARADGSTNVRTFLICDAVIGGVSQGFYGADVSTGSASFGFDLSNGSYTLKVSAPGFLRKNQSASLSTSTPLTGLDFDLEFGDLDGDNYVSQDEVDFIYDHIGDDPLDPEDVTDFDNDYPLALCDADQDGEITIDDFNAADANVGHYGD